MDVFKVVFVTLLCLYESPVHSATRQARLSLAEPSSNYFYRNIDGNPNTYSFGYDVQDSPSGNNQYRREQRYGNGTVVGSYGYIDAAGKSRRYSYIADERGYRLLNEPTQNSHYVSSSTPNPVSRPPTEDSITWTRPKRPNKKKVPVAYNKNYNRRNYLIQNPYYRFSAYPVAIRPPSQYFGFYG